MRACPDGYPSCRQAEATGKWCAGECAAMSAPRAEPDRQALKTPSPPPAARLPLAIPQTNRNKK